MLDPWDSLLNEQRIRRFDRYKTLRLHLTDAHTDFKFDISGGFLFVEKASSATAAATIRINQVINDQIDLRLHTKIETVFTEIYLSNAAQAGEWIELVIGCQFTIDRPNPSTNRQSQAAILITCTLANTNYAGAAFPCEIVLIKADVQNIGTIWIDFNNAAVQNACLPLDSGDWTRHRIANVNLINANAEIATEFLIVIPEV